MLPKIDCRTTPKYQKHNNEMPYFGLYIHVLWIINLGPSWSWSYGSWIYNYLCNRYLSPLKLWVLIPLMGRCTRYIIMW